MIDLSNLKIRTETSYTWSSLISVPIPESINALLEKQDKDAGLFFFPAQNPECIKQLEDILDNEEVKNRFAAMAKKKGFDKTSTGLSVRTHNTSDRHTHVIEVSMTRKKG